MGGTRDEVTQIARAEAVAVVKQHMRAEAKAQATIAKKELADLINPILEGDRKRRDETDGRLADGLARLTVICDVLTDLACAQVNPLDGMLPHDRRRELHRLCDEKARSFEAGA